MAGKLASYTDSTTAGKALYVKNITTSTKKNFYFEKYFL